MFVSAFSLVKKPNQYFKISGSSRLIKVLAMTFTLVYLTGCSALSSYDSKSDKLMSNLRVGDVNAAIQPFMKDKRGKASSLHYMEKGNVQNFSGDSEGAINSWREADAYVAEWENTAKVNPESLIKGVGSLLVNDKVIDYEPTDYEKVFLTTKMALLEASKGNWDVARTEIKKTHEREAVIDEINAKKYAVVEDDVKNSNQQVKSYKDIDGYPVEIFESSEVLALKNSYQNALSHYLAGFIYEAIGEPGLAAPGYRKAIELKPNTPVLEDALAGLDSRSGLGGAENSSEVLFIISSGEIAERNSMQIPIPLFTTKGLIVAPISFPVMTESEAMYSDVMSLDGQVVEAQTILNLNAMAARELKDDMPGILLRTTIRAAAKAIAQKEAEERDAIAGLALMLVNIVTETADERMWRTLPSKVKLARKTLEYGEHTFMVGGKVYKIDVDSPFTLLPIRVIGGQTYTIVKSEQEKERLALIESQKENDN